MILHGGAHPSTTASRQARDIRLGQFHTSTPHLNFIADLQALHALGCRLEASKGQTRCAVTVWSPTLDIRPSKPRRTLVSSRLKSSAIGR